MTTEQHTPIVGEDPSGTQVPDQEVEPTEEPKPNADLHAYNKRLKTENKELRGRILETDLAVIGLNVGEGLGKAIAKEYDGELTTEALATYARDEYGHDSAVTTEVPAGVQSLEKLDQALQTSVPVTPVEPLPPGQEVIDKLDDNDPEATRQDALRSIKAKSARFQETFYK